MTQIRPENSSDVPAIRSVNTAAFPSPAEADLVDKLRSDGAHVLSLVALDGERVIGHILFSPVVIETESGTIDAIGLGPMSVLPESQRSGIGSQLVKTGLSQCAAMSHSAMVVLGHPDYYPRFGFIRADRRNISCEFPSPPEAFMVMELQDGALDGVSGLAKYHRAFSEM